MTQVAIAGRGIPYPSPITVVDDINHAATAAMDAATKKVAFIGTCFIEGRASSKTISSAGGAIYFRPGTTTFANAGTTLRVGIQDVDAASGPPGRPDGTFDVYGDLASGSLTSNTNASISMSSGSKTISNGDLIAIVFDMTARGGADSIVITTINSLSELLPCAVTYNAVTWAAATGVPAATIKFDDGTYGCIFGSFPQCTITSDSWADSTNPDERGNVFQVPWDCQIDGFWAVLGINTSANADFTVRVVSDPFGTPSDLASAVILAEQTVGGASNKYVFGNFNAPVTLSKNTDYVISVRATGSATVFTRMLVFDTSNFRKLLNGGLTVTKVTRNNGSGTFSTATATIYQMGVIISSLDDGTGAGGASSRMLVQQANRRSQYY